MYQWQIFRWLAGKSASDDVGRLQAMVQRATVWESGREAYFEGIKAAFTVIQDSVGYLVVLIKVIVSSLAKHAKLVLRDLCT